MPILNHHFVLCNTKFVRYYYSIMGLYLLLIQYMYRGSR
uniref:Uncharacterized protein n=1 Tax=Ciona intestinalis TaxID=7719 RepID=H2XV75_CIOIN